MTSNQTRRLTALGQTVTFSNLYPADFPEGTKAADLMTQIRAAEADAKAGAAGQQSNHGTMLSGTQTKSELFDDLYDELRAISRTAKAIASEVPGLDGKFRLPRSSAYSQILATARAFLADATPLEAKFVEYEMPPTFLADLANDITGFEIAEDDQGAGLTNRVGATRSVAEAIMAGSAALRNLDPLMRNKYRDNPVKLVEWLSASHVERTPQKAPAPAVVAS
ncbi:MAG: hypothetical protein H8M99_05380 [Gloeobacteraceae cyanobacterium ES-bin-144]|nr:hypothetical protein [Verrucomicrobiales bacterium]